MYEDGDTIKVGEWFAAVSKLSRKYPDLVLKCDVRNGCISFGIPKGAEGDTFATELGMTDWATHGYGKE